MYLYNVSVIIPIYNVEKYLEEALYSVVNQSLENIEVILINDGSTDTSLDIAIKFSKKYEFVKVYDQENRGVSASRNTGIKLARGKYLYFMDSDDYINQFALKKLFGVCEGNELELILFSGKSFFDKNYKGDRKKLIAYDRKNKYSMPLSGVNMFKSLVKNNEYYCSPCLYLVRKSTLNEKEIFFYENIIHEDELFTFKLLLSTERVGVINEILFFRRIRDSSIITEKNYYKSFIGYHTVLTEMIKFRETKKQIEPEIMKSINVKISQIYRITLNKYINLSEEHKIILRNQIKELKIIGKKNVFFNRLELRFFYYSERTYYVLYKLASEFYKKRK